MLWAALTVAVERNLGPVGHPKLLGGLATPAERLAGDGLAGNLTQDIVLRQTVPDPAFTGDPVLI